MGQNQRNLAKIERKICVKRDIYMIFRVIITFICSLLMFSLPTHAVAQESDFAPKFGKPPERGAKKRINVMISKDAGRLVVTSVPRGSGAAGAIPFDWFWEKIQPLERFDIKTADFELALGHIKSHPQGSVVTPSVATMMELVARWKGPLLMAGAQHRVSPALLASVMWVESRGKQSAVSSAGAQGLMQLIPATAARFGVDDPFDATANVRGSAASLSWLLQDFRGDPVLALAGYNAGENAVKTAGGVPNYAETRGYVPKVLAAYSVARGLCKTPPVLVTDGCIFQLPDGN